MNKGLFIGGLVLYLGICLFAYMVIEPVWAYLVIVLGAYFAGYLVAKS